MHSNQTDARVSAGDLCCSTKSTSMKPIINQIEAPCFHCNKTIVHTVHLRIDGQHYPDLKTKVLNSTAFVTQCPHCIGFSEVPQDFRYFDAVGKTRYMIYYFPSDAAEELEDVIAATMNLRSNGTRVHMIHKLTEIVPIINSYDQGEIAKEQLMEVGDKASIRTDALFGALDNSMNEIFSAFEMHGETGKFPKGFIDQIAPNQKKPRKKSFFRKLFGG